MERLDANGCVAAFCTGYLEPRMDWWLRSIGDRGSYDLDVAESARVSRSIINEQLDVQSSSRRANLVKS